MITTTMINNQTCVMINGHIGADFRVERGLRQGDPLSLYLFLLAMEPVIIALNKNTAIQGLHLPASGGKVVKTIAYADDTTLVLQDEQSVSQAFFVLGEYLTATGIKVNFSKVTALKLGRKQSKNSQLPTLSWVDSINVLNVPYGKPQAITDWLENKVRSMRLKVSNFSKFRSTYDVKSLM
ncbi:unnamed protein product [Clavelina lepadiformis]|uniref:Reverse transcriptase domain-containing protein n=1 Tax=Clavelina lepadiformis TaxID=159417 RepID=A0ABP0G506_CLALP